MVKNSTLKVMSSNMSFAYNHSVEGIANYRSMICCWASRSLLISLSVGIAWICSELW